MIQGQRGNQFVRAPLVEHLDACEGKTLGELDVSNVFYTCRRIQNRNQTL